MVEREAKRRRFPKRLAKFALLVCALLFCLLIADGLTRVLRLDRPLIWRPDKQLGWRLIPNARRHYTKEGDGWVEVNSLGFRDRSDRKWTKDEEVFRVLVLGDSQTEAVQVNLDQTYCHKCETELSSAKRPVEVWSLGVSGYSPVQELLQLKKYVDRIKPDLIVLSVFLDNDVSGCHSQLNAVQWGPIAKRKGDVLTFDFSQCEISVADYEAMPTYVIRKYSALYRFARHVYSELKTKQESNLGVPSRFQLYNKTTSAKWEEAWRVFDLIIRKIDEIATRRNVPLVFNLIPAAQVVNKKAWDSILEVYPAMKDVEWDLDGPETRFLELASKLDRTTVIVTEDFRSQQAGAPLFFGNVGHLTPRGHAMIATKLAATLQPMITSK